MLGIIQNKPILLGEKPHVSKKSARYGYQTPKLLYITKYKDLKLRISFGLSSLPVSALDFISIRLEEVSPQ